MELNDKELDELIMATMERRAMLGALNSNIVKDVRRKARRERFRRWGRIVAFSFGLPLLLLLFGLGLWLLLTIPSVWPVRFTLLLPVATVLYFAWRSMRDFSIAEV